MTRHVLLAGAVATTLLASGAARGDGPNATFDRILGSAAPASVGFDGTGFGGAGGDLLDVALGPADIFYSPSALADRDAGANLYAIGIDIAASVGGAPSSETTDAGAANDDDSDYGSLVSAVIGLGFPPQ